MGLGPSLNSPIPLFDFVVLKLDLSSFLSVEFFKDISLKEKFGLGRPVLQIIEITLSMSFDQRLNVDMLFSFKEDPNDSEKKAFNFTFYFNRQEKKQSSLAVIN